MRSTLFAVFALLSLAAPSFVYGQMLGAPEDTNPFTISVSPQYPRPYSQSVVSVTSSTINLVNATVIVTLGGKEIYRGNAAPVSIPLGGAGSVANIGVTAIADGNTFVRSVSIQPQDVVLVPEPLSSAPILYKGKPLVPEDGDVRVVAVANLRNSGGSRVAPSSLSYSWTVDGARIGSSSGIGKSALVVASPLLYRSRTVSVDVTSGDGALVGGSSLSLSPSQPIVRVYRSDPLLGIRFEQALGGPYEIEGSEDAFYAAPFSFSTALGAPSIEWFLNSKPVQTGPLITVRPSGESRGSASLSSVVSAGAAKASVVLPLSFGSGGFNLFGI